MKTHPNVWGDGDAKQFMKALGRLYDSGFTVPAKDSGREYWGEELNDIPVYKIEDACRYIVKHQESKTVVPAIIRSAVSALANFHTPAAPDKTLAEWMKENHLEFPEEQWQLSVGRLWYCLSQFWRYGRGWDAEGWLKRGIALDERGEPMKCIPLRASLRDYEVFIVSNTMRPQIPEAIGRGRKFTSQPTTAGDVFPLAVE